MNYLSAIIVCKASGTPIKLRELRNIQKNEKELESYLRAIIELHKAGVKYDREILTNYYLNNGNIENVSHGPVIAKKVGQFLSLSEAIEKDQKGIDFIEQYKKELKTGHNNV